MATSECPDCERHFVGDRCVCGYSVRRDRMPVVEGYRLYTPTGPRPCTDAQNKQAWRITMDVMEGKCTAEEGQRRLKAIFGPALSEP